MLIVRAHLDLPLRAVVRLRAAGQRSRLRAQRREAQARIHRRHVPRGTDGPRQQAAGPRARGDPELRLGGGPAVEDEIVQAGLDARRGAGGRRPERLVEGLAAGGGVLVRAAGAEQDHGRVHVRTTRAWFELITVHGAVSVGCVGGSSK